MDFAGLPKWDPASRGHCPACRDGFASYEDLVWLDHSSGLCRPCWRVTVLAVAFVGLAAAPPAPRPCPGSPYFYTVGKVDHCGLCRGPRHDK